MGTMYTIKRTLCGRNYIKCCTIFLLSASFTALVELYLWKSNPSSTTFMSQSRRRDSSVTFNPIATHVNGINNINKQTRTSQKYNVQDNNLHVFNVSLKEKDVAEVDTKWCVPFYSRQKDCKLCVYDPASDVWISGSIVKTGAWEQDLLNLTEEFQKMDPNLDMLDIGCNIGVYTVFYSTLGQRVVSIDANEKNLILLSKSLSINGLSDRVTLINNAVSDVRQGVELTEDHRNVGGLAVKAVTNGTNSGKTVSTILIDDLIPIFKNRTVLIKMDIEGYEWKALNGAWEFFKNVDVKYVLMEYVVHKGKESGRQIRDFLTRFGFLPYIVPNYNIELNIKDDKKYPGDMLWIKTAN